MRDSKALCLTLGLGLVSAVASSASLDLPSTDAQIRPGGKLSLQTSGSSVGTPDGEEGQLSIPCHRPAPCA